MKQSKFSTEGVEMPFPTTKWALPNIKPLACLVTASAVLALTGCGNAKTTIIERDPIPVDVDNEHNHGEEHDDHNSGRLLVFNASALQSQVFNLADRDLITTIPLDTLPSAVHASGDYRFAALIERDGDKISFIDGGLWQEPHDDHFDEIAALPTLLNNSLIGSRPTHFVRHEGQVAIFFDGDANVGSNASIQVLNDAHIATAATPTSLNFDVPMHGAAEPRGAHLLASIRRDDAQSTSTNFVLPDQVGVYHLHDGAYELEQTFDVSCPNLHGAAQNETHVAFGCGDGILLATEDDNGGYSAQKLLNPETMIEGARIGSVWGHEASDQFIGQATHGDASQFFSIDPTEGEMELIDWQPMSGAKPVARDFAFEAEQFVILDNQGYLTLIEPHEENGHIHWDYHGARLDITDADITSMPEGMNFSMTLAQNGHTAYIADPIAQHIVVVDLDLMEKTAEIELDYAPSMITWLGIAEAHDH